MSEEALKEDFVLPIGKAKIERSGTDVTIVSYSKGVQLGLEAHEQLKKIGISAEVTPQITFSLKIDLGDKSPDSSSIGLRYD